MYLYQGQYLVSALPTGEIGTPHMGSSMARTYRRFAPYDVRRPKLFGTMKQALSALENVDVPLSKRNRLNQFLSFSTWGNKAVSALKEQR